ncbi:MAG: flavodoxin family protein [Candidatus Bathyarchaeota archaeon]|nr:flavodoxin family protein [Candidatus Bathyarchaeota archaeon]
MVKVMVVYESKYGNTKLVAEKIIKGIGETEGIETVLSEVKRLTSTIWLIMMRS